MVTFITVFFGGVISALVTLFLGQPLQDYFWRRQRYAERQFAVIDRLNQWAAELEYYFTMNQLSQEAQDNLFKTLTMLSGNVGILFSPRAAERCQTLHAVVMKRLHAPELAPEHRQQLKQQFHEAHQDALKVLYKDMGLPPPATLWQWLRAHVGGRS